MYVIVIGAEDLKFMYSKIVPFKISFSSLRLEIESFC